MFFFFFLEISDSQNDPRAAELVPHFTFATAERLREREGRRRTITTTAPRAYPGYKVRVPFPLSCLQLKNPRSSFGSDPAGVF